MELNKVYCGDCLEEMKNLEDNSIDAVITDPPYGLSFMGKKWDYDVPSVEIWQECLRVLKPGGYLLSFAGTRTQHRMAVRIEDAGFEIRDMIAWVYGSGFPKSHNIGKAIDKHGGVSVSWFGEWLRNWRKENSITQKEVAKLFPSKTGGLTGCVANWELGLNIPTNEQFNLICKTFNLPFENLEEAEREFIKKDKNWGDKGTVPLTGYKEFNVTKGTSEYEGWGTALKPALEPITVARKPLSEKTVAENVLKWGTGGINIDGCRVETDGEDRSARYNSKPSNSSLDNSKKGTVQFGDRPEVWKAPEGRFPANLIHDGSDEVVDLFPNETQRFFYSPKASKSERNRGCEGLEEKINKFGNQKNGEDIGNKSVNDKFTTLPSKNNHPTVKPIALMEYLVKLVTRENALVLDPFGGSGTTGIACQNLGRNYILMEKDEEYVKIAEERLKQKPLI